MVNPVFAPYSQTYASRRPYITSAEYLAAPTGTNVSNLIPGGTPQQNADSLTDTILRACGWVDQITNQIMSATLETQTGRYAVRNNALVIPVTQSPIVAVYGLNVGTKPSQMFAVTDFTDLEIDGKVITIPAAAVGVFAGLARVTLTYVAGYANAIVAAAAAPGQTTLTLDNVLGVAPGLSLWVSDPGSNELITALSTSGNVVTLASPLTKAHAVGVGVSALPPALKLATILLTTVAIKTGNDESFVFASSRTMPREREVTPPGVTKDIYDAKELLGNFLRVI